MANAVQSEAQNKEVLAVVVYTLRSFSKKGTYLLRKEMYSPTTCLVFG